jgi:hypothetical protein
VSYESYIKGVSYVTNNVKKRSYEHTKRYPVVYYYDESGNFHSKRIKWYEVPWYKMQICKQKSLTCEFCKKKFTLLVRKNEKPQCPNCLEY